MHQNRTERVSSFWIFT